MKRLRLSPNVALPLDAVTQTFAILGKRGSGKTNSAGVMTEQMIEAGLPVVAVDPIGVWWGLRHSRDGKKPGLSVVILGGEHADVPLEETGGAVVADFLIEHRAPAVLDLGVFSKGAQRRFMTDFAERLYHKNREALHIVLDEADTFCLSDDTELLTRSGWKRWERIRPGEDAVCFDLKAEEYRYGAVERLIVKHHDGEMVWFKSKNVDCLVTPDHRVVLRRFQRVAGRRRWYPWTFVPAEKVGTQTCLPYGGAPCGLGVDGLSVEDCRVLGWIITDGSVHDRTKRNRKLTVEQSSATTKREIGIARLMDETLMAIPGVTRYTRVRRTGAKPSTATQFRWYLGGDATDRYRRWLGDDIHRVPRALIEQMSRQQIEAMYLGLLEGDGTSTNGRWVGFYPGLDEGLADDFQEVALRAGVGTTKRWNEITCQWNVTVASLRRHHAVYKPVRERYTGIVWDVTVPTGAFVARRNGRVFVTGNCPQRIDHGGERLVGAINDLVRKGRARGIGVTLISQRPALVNKDVLTQVEVLVAHRMTGPQDRDAIERWIEHNADGGEDVLSSLQSLGDGDAWVWSPSWLATLKRTHIDLRSTFDSSATPKAGAHRVSPKKAAEVDLGALRDKLAASIERAKQEDPRALRAKIAELEKAARKPAVVAAPKVELVETIEVPAFSAKDRAAIERLGKSLDRHRDALSAAVKSGEAAERDAQSVVTLVDKLADRIEQIRATGPSAPRLVAPPVVKPVVMAPPRVARALALVEQPKTKPQSNGKPNGAPVASGDLKLGAGHKRILLALAQHGTLSKQQIAVFARYTLKGGGFNNYLGQLRTAGYITGGLENEPATITESGLTALGPYDTLPQTAEELFEHWMHHPKLGKAHRAILTVLRENGGGPMEAVDVAVACDPPYEADGGGFNNAVGRLRTMGVIEGGKHDLRLKAQLLS